MSDIERIIRDAEWRGSVVTTLDTIADKLKDLEGEADKASTERTDICTRLGKLESKIEELSKAVDRIGRKTGGMGPKERVTLYVGIITALSVAGYNIAVAIINAFH